MYTFTVLSVVAYETFYWQIKLTDHRPLPGNPCTTIFLQHLANFGDQVVYLGTVGRVRGQQGIVGWA